MEAAPIRIPDEAVPVPVERTPDPHPAEPPDPKEAFALIEVFLRDRQARGEA